MAVSCGTFNVKGNWCSPTPLATPHVSRFRRNTLHVRDSEPCVTDESVRVANDGVRVGNVTYPYPPSYPHLTPRNPYHTTHDYTHKEHLEEGVTRVTAVTAIHPIKGELPFLVELVINP